MVDLAVEERPRDVLSSDDFSGVVSRYRRYIPLVGAITLAALPLSIVATFTMKPLYTATATVLYAPERQVVAPTAQDNQPAPSDAQDQAVDTQAAALTSPEIALRVEAMLGLQNDPEFNRRARTLKFA